MRGRLWTLPVLAVVVTVLLLGGPAPTHAQAPAAVGTATVEVPPPVGAADPCQVSYVVVGQWSNGFVANVTVRNVSTVPVRWTVSITYLGGEIIQAWNVVVTRTGNTWTFTRPPWLGSLDILLPGQSATFGLTGTGNGVPARVSVICVPVSG